MSSTEFRPESKMTEVTVFESSAQIRRVATIDKMPKGEVVVIFSDLPQVLDRDNVQVAVKFDSGKTDAATEKEATCSLRGVSFKTETVEKSKQTCSSEERDEYRKKIADANRELKDAQDELADCESQSQFFTAAVNSAVSGDRQEEDLSEVLGDVEHWKSMFDTAHTMDKKTLAEKRAVEAKIHDIQERLNVLNRELAQRGGGLITMTTNVVAVTLVASRELTDVDVRISYVVNQAKWSAEYDVRFDPENNEAKVTYNAVVSQTGREDWKNVILTISTARPTISGKPKELVPWHAKIFVPAVVRSSARAKSSSMFGGSKRSAAPQLERAEECCEMALDDDEGDILEEALESLALQSYSAPTVESAKVKEGATSMSFYIDSHPYSISNNGKSVRVTLAIVPVKSSVSYICRPKLTETVFARMKAVNLSEFTLLEGPALVFCGQQFISKTTLKRCAPSDDFSVNIGADNDITVKYKKIKNERSQSGGGMFSSEKVKYNNTTKITVNNRKQVPIKITVEDQIPLSQHSDIDVKLIQPAPPAEDDADYAKRKDQLREGKIVFESAELKSQSEKVFPIEFTVSHPKDFEMEGL